MEQQTKNCPYCGEEIMAIAKKCKHCGEWLVKPQDLERHQQPIKKESYFNSKYLYDKVWMNLIFGVTIIGSFIQSVHQSGLAVPESTRSFLKFIRFAGEIPETVGDFLCAAGEICFIVLLMEVFSHLHKPLKGWFLIDIVFSVILALLSLMIPGDSLNDSMDIFEMIILLILFLTPILLLPIMIILNYEGKIKTLGWIIIGYTIITFIVGQVAEYFIPIIGFLLLFLLDFYYYKYLRDSLTKA